MKGIRKVFTLAVAEVGVVGAGVGVGTVGVLMPSTYI